MKVSQHVWATVGIFLGVFLSTWLQSPSVESYLSHHSWMADIVGAGFVAYHVIQTYKTPQDPKQPQPKENL